MHAQLNHLLNQQRRADLQRAARRERLAAGRRRGSSAPATTNQGRTAMP